MRAIRARKGYRVCEFSERRTITYALTDQNDKVSDFVTDLDCGLLVKERAAQWVQSPPGDIVPTGGRFVTFY